MSARTLDHGLRHAQRPEGAEQGRHTARDEAEIWRRFQTAQRSDEWAALDQKTVAVFRHMVALVTNGDAADYVRLDRLIQELGHQQLAAIQSRLDHLLSLGRDLPLLTITLRRLWETQAIGWRLAASGIEDAEAARILDRCDAHRSWLLITEADDAGTSPRLQTPADIVRLAEHGNARLWRAALAPVARNPWAPEADRLIALANSANWSLLERSLLKFRGLCRSRQEERERLSVAREIRRLVAISGVSQREFAARIGTSGSRLSTYATGKVTPSAAMLVRIQHTSRMLISRRDAVA